MVRNGITASVQTTGRSPDLKVFADTHPSRPACQWVFANTGSCGCSFSVCRSRMTFPVISAPVLRRYPLAQYSDEFAQDSHLLPFSTASRRSLLSCHLSSHGGRSRICSLRHLIHDNIQKCLQQGQAPEVFLYQIFLPSVSFRYLRRLFPAEDFTGGDQTSGKPVSVLVPAVCFSLDYKENVSCTL